MERARGVPSPSRALRALVAQDRLLLPVTRAVVMYLENNNGAGEGSSFAFSCTPCTRRSGQASPPRHSCCSYVFGEQ
jgi:hypothetical protein